MRSSSTLIKEAEGQRNRLIQDLSNAITNLFINYNVELHSTSETPSSIYISEWDHIIYAIVEALRAILLFGLKEKKVRKIGSFFEKKPLTLPKKDDHFWPFVKEISSKCTIEMIENFGTENAFFQSEEGKEVGWIIQTLNDGFVLQNFDVIKTNPNVVKKYYESFALLLDDRKLVSIEFLVSDLPKFSFHLNPHLFKPLGKITVGGNSRVSSRLSLSTKSSLEKLISRDKSIAFPEAVESVTEIVVKPRVSKKPKDASFFQQPQEEFNDSVQDAVSLNDTNISDIDIDNKSLQEDGILGTNLLLPDQDEQKSPTLHRRVSSDLLLSSLDESLVYHRRVSSDLIIPSNPAPDSSDDNISNSSDSDSTVSSTCVDDKTYKNVQSGLDIDFVFQKLSASMDADSNISSFIKPLSSFARDHTANESSPIPEMKISSSPLCVEPESDQESSEESIENQNQNENEAIKVVYKPESEKEEIPNNNNLLKEDIEVPSHGTNILSTVLKNSTSYLGSAVSYVGEKIAHMAFSPSETSHEPIQDQQFEVINSHSNSPIQFKEPVEWRICPIKGLAQQRYKCPQCGKPIGVGMFMEARLCDISGYYFCTHCHQNDMIISPARIINNWDFQPVKVSKPVLRHVEESKTLAVINLEKRNPFVFRQVPELQKVKNLREELMITKDFVMTCKMTTKHSLLKLIWPREHLFDNPDLYSVEDLEDVFKETLSVFLQNIASAYRKHILYQCELCVVKGSFCEYCKSPKIIYPFESKTIRCSVCHTLSHRECYKGPENCSKCQRIANRVNKT